jgi:hypothetical protein
MTSDKPLALTIDDHAEARADHPATLHMHWPVDAETTARLKRVIGSSEKLNRLRRLIRWLTRT